MTIRTAYASSNLYIELYGNFTSREAERLADVIYHSFSGKGNIYVNTHDVRDVFPEGVTLFAKLAKCLKTAHQLILVGEKGLAIAPEGCQVIVDEQDKDGCRKTAPIAGAANASNCKAIP